MASSRRSISALFVAGVVVSVSWRLARRTTDALLDAAPPEFAPRSSTPFRGWMVYSKSAAFASAAPAIVLRRSCRRLGAYRYLPAFRTVSGSGHRRCAWHPSRRRRHCATLPRANGRKISSTDSCRRHPHNLNVHDISVQDLAGKLHVEQHVELDERMSSKALTISDRPRSRYAS